MTQTEPSCVLVVDDEPDMREAISLLLEGRGYQVLTAQHGAEALDVLRRTRPSVILLDLMMPVMDGWQFRAAQLLEPSLAAIPVVIVTGAGVAAEPTGPFGAVTAFLRKPFESDVLLQLLEEICAADPAGANPPR